MDKPADRAVRESPQDLANRLGLRLHLRGLGVARVRRLQDGGVKLQRGGQIGVILVQGGSPDFQAARQRFFGLFRYARLDVDPGQIEEQLGDQAIYAGRSVLKA